MAGIGLPRWRAALAAGLLAVVVGGAAAGTSSAPSALAAHEQARPDLAAKFRVSLTLAGGHTQRQEWQLTRSASEISWIKGDGVEEIWRRDRSGIRLERVLRADRHVIDYPAGELRAMAVTLDWQELGGLFSEAALARLKPSGLARQDQPQRWQGVVDGEKIDLQWDPIASLPIRLARSGRNGRVLFERTALHQATPAGWPQAGAGVEDFQRLDAADFGDMADNPVVRKALARDQKAGWRQAH